MRTSRDCVENFWFLHIENFLNNNIAPAQYCREHGLKKQSLHPWIGKYREKYPEKFKGEVFFNDAGATSTSEDSQTTPKDLFIEICKKPKKQILDYSNVPTSAIEKLNIKVRIKNLEFEFSTYPQIKWLASFVKELG